MELRKTEYRWTRPVARGEGIDTDTATEELFRKFQVNEIMRERRRGGTVCNTCTWMHFYTLIDVCTCKVFSSSPFLPLPLPRVF